MTPTELKPAVLRALHEVSGGRTDIEVRSQDVLERALAHAAVERSSPAWGKAYSNAHWAATQMLRKDGVFVLGTRRGWWRLLTAEETMTQREGLAKEPAAPEPPTGALAMFGTAEERSDDGAGYPFPVGPRPADPLGVDPYLLSLARKSATCFADPGFGWMSLAAPGEATPCDGCILASACYDMWIFRVRERAGRLNAAMLAEPTPKTVSSNEELGSIVRELEEGAQRRTRFAPFKLKSEVGVGETWAQAEGRRVRTITGRFGATSAPELHDFRARNPSPGTTKRILSIVRGVCFACGNEFLTGTPVELHIGRGAKCLACATAP